MGLRDAALARARRQSRGGRARSSDRRRCRIAPRNVARDGALLGLECPPELQGQRRALQLKQLRDRFQGAAPAGANNAGERLLAWCAQPGVADARDRQRCEQVFAAMEQTRRSGRSQLALRPLAGNACAGPTVPE